MAKKIYTTSVIMDIHPNGEVYIWDGNKTLFIGFFMDKESSGPGVAVVYKRREALFRKFKLTLPKVAN